MLLQHRDHRFSAFPIHSCRLEILRAFLATTVSISSFMIFFNSIYSLSSVFGACFPTTSIGHSCCHARVVIFWYHLIFCRNPSQEFGFKLQSFSCKFGLSPLYGCASFVASLLAGLLCEPIPGYRRIIES